MRRKKREVVASEILDSTQDSTQDTPWEELRLVLDGTLSELNPEQRDVLLLRFFGKHSYSEIGALLKVSDDVAQKRVSRALLKLRSSLGKRGITSSAAALATLLEAHAVITAPAALTSAIVATISSGSAVAAASVAIPLFTMNTIKVSVTAAMAVAGVGGLVWQ